MAQDDNRWCELDFAEPAPVFKGPDQTARAVTEARVALHGFYPDCAAPLCVLCVPLCGLCDEPDDAAPTPARRVPAPILGSSPSMTG